MKPFRWKLKEVNPASVLAVEALYSFLPNTLVRETLSLELRKVLMQHLGNETYFCVESVDLQPCRDWVKSCTDPSVVLVVGLTPLSQKLLVHVDYVLAHAIVNKLLGGEVDATPELRLLTDAEVGVVQYLAMQVMLQLHRICGHEERVHFRHERILQRMDDIVPLVPAKEEGVVMTVRLGFGEVVGFLRLLLPNAFIAQAMTEPLSLAGDERFHMGDRLSQIGHIKTSVWAEAGTVTITPEELSQLERGDVILMDHSEVSFQGKKLGGEVKIHVGDGQHGSIVADVDPKKDMVRCTLKSFERGGPYGEKI